MGRKNCCPRCGADNELGHSYCSVCKAEIDIDKVRTMTAAEREEFYGVTIEQNNDQSYKSKGFNKTGSSSCCYVRHIKFGSSSTGVIVKMLIGAGLAALIMIIVLPVMMTFLIAVIITGCFVLRRR